MYTRTDNLSRTADILECKQMHSRKVKTHNGEPTFPLKVITRRVVPGQTWPWRAMSRDNVRLRF